MCSSSALAGALVDRAASTGPESLALYLSAQPGIAVVIATGDVDALLSAMDAADVGLHEIALRQVLTHRRTWPVGENTPGLTQLYFSQRRPGLSANDYHRHWHLEHRDRALRHHMGMWDYAQVSVIETRKGRHVDGITVTQWPQLEDLTERSTNGPDGRAVITEDSSRFTDIPTLERHRMTERIVMEGPWPTTGSVPITDFRSEEFDVPAHDVWSVLGRFDAINDWWPTPFADVATSSDHMPGMTRTLTRRDGSILVERLVEYRPDERMLQLAIDEGLPDSIVGYTCRYEVRIVDENRCRLDWYPRAVVRAGGRETFAAVVDRGWPMVVAGLRTAVEVTT